MSIINKMLQDLDRRHAMAGADQAIPPRQVRAVEGARPGREWFWRTIAALMLAAAPGGMDRLPASVAAARDGTCVARGRGSEIAQTGGCARAGCRGAGPACRDRKTRRACRDLQARTKHRDSDQRARAEAGGQRKRARRRRSRACGAGTRKSSSPPKRLPSKKKTHSRRSRSTCRPHACCRYPWALRRRSKNAIASVRRLSAPRRSIAAR